MPDEKPTPTHVIQETVTTDREKMIAAAGPAFTPMVVAWHAGLAELARVNSAAELEKARIADAGITRRSAMATYTLVGVSVIVATLAGIAMWTGNGGIAEKIVFGLFAFVGGFSARR